MVRVAGISSATVLAPTLVEIVVDVVSTTGLSADTVTTSVCDPTVIGMFTSAENPAVI
jgi:hypothetical protein